MDSSRTRERESPKSRRKEFTQQSEKKVPATQREVKNYLEFRLGPDEDLKIPESLSSDDSFSSIFKEIIRRACILAKAFSLDKSVMNSTVTTTFFAEPRPQSIRELQSLLKTACENKKAFKLKVRNDIKCLCDQISRLQDKNSELKSTIMKRTEQNRILIEQLET